MRSVFAAAAMVLVSTPAWAASSLEAPYAGVLVERVEPDNGRGTQYGTGFSVLAAMGLARDLFLELRASHTNLETGSNAGTDFYQAKLGADVLHPFTRGEVKPFVSLGVGIARNDVTPNTRDDTGFFAAASAGLFWEPRNYFGLKFRVEARLEHDSFDGGQNDLRFGAGVIIPLRVKPEPVVTIESGFAPTPPPPAPPPPAPPPPPTVVADTDHDGVKDDVDRCPGTFAGAQVDERGCVRERTAIVLQGIEFDTGAATLTPRGFEAVVRAKDALQSQPTMRVEIGGHTDAVGSERTNLTLSQRRAEAVQRGLTDLGVDAQRLMARGYGESSPIASNDDDAGRARNRRVEFLVTQQ